MKTIKDMAKELWYFGIQPPLEYRLEVEQFIRDHLKYFRAYSAKYMNQW